MRRFRVSFVGIHIGNAANQNLQLSNKLVNDPLDDGEDEERRKNQDVLDTFFFFFKIRN